MNAVLVLCALLLAAEHTPVQIWVKVLHGTGDESQKADIDPYVLIALAADPSADESISVTVVGKLRTGIVAIGGETTGTTITAKGVTWELDFAKNADLRKAAETLNGKKVAVRGTLERRVGVEAKERWIVTVTELKSVEGDGSK